MNYYEPRELKRPDGLASGVWHYTCMNDGHIWPVGYCAEHNCQHETPIEASDCYRKYIREQRGGLLPGGFKMDTGDPEKDNRELIMQSSY